MRWLSIYQYGGHLLYFVSRYSVSSLDFHEKQHVNLDCIVASHLLTTYSSRDFEMMKGGSERGRNSTVLHNETTTMTKKYVLKVSHYAIVSWS